MASPTDFEKAQSEHLVAYSRLGAGLRELASGVDALYMSGRAVLPTTLLDRLVEGKAQAIEGTATTTLDLAGESFRVAGSGMGRYPYRLEHDRGPVGVTASSHLPTFRVQPRSEFLHAVGAPAVVEWYQQVLDEMCGKAALTVSRIDLHADWQGWNLGGDDRHRFVCRATNRDTYEEYEVFTGFVFGRRATGTVLCRIYDKTREIEKTGHDWWKDKWAHRFDDSERVLRVEFEFGREGLRQFQMSRPEEALDAIGDLWRYATGDWLTYRDPTDDQTKARWPVSQAWADVQAASLRSEVVGLARIKEGALRGSLRKLLPGLNGYVVSLAAITGASTIEEALEPLTYHLHEYENASGRLFADRVVERLGAA